MPPLSSLLPPVLARPLAALALLLAAASATQAQTTTFPYTAPGGAQTYTVPAGVTSIRVVATGASGGLLFNTATSSYSYGGQVQATVAVTPGETLTVRVGGQGTTNNGNAAYFAGGFNGGGAGTDDTGGNGGGGGGGATDLRRTGASTGDYLTSRNALVVAGGGGGSSYGTATGGNGGAPNGGDGGAYGSGGSNPGQGATQARPGTGSNGAFSGSNGTGGDAGDGSLGFNDYGGGGGGGYYGGSGGSSGGMDNVGGGGGSSWAMPTASSVSYSVATTAGNGSLTITPTAAPLPVQLTTFTAEAAGPAARLRWATASETANDHFEVEASADGRAFQRLGTVAGHGSTLLPQQYAYLDEGITRYAAPLVYYRLRQVDQDGTSTYSVVRTVAVGKGSLTLYPNPAGRTATLSGTTAGAPVQVLDALGRLVRTATADAAGTAVLALPAGLYLVRSGTTPALRLVVE